MIEMKMTNEEIVAKVEAEDRAYEARISRNPNFKPAKKTAGRDRFEVSITDSHLCAGCATAKHQGACE